MNVPAKKSGNWDTLLYRIYGGPKEEWEPWTSHGIIGIDGKIVQVHIRPEKQNGLLQLLQSTPGYWWIDIFCVQSKDPLSIMGDIYRFYGWCYALVDFPSAGFGQIKNIIVTLQSDRPEDDAFAKYMDRINGKMGSADHTWLESLDDLLAGWYRGDPADIKVLADFFNCQWFKRVWTLQEYILPRVLTFTSETDPLDCYLDRVSLNPIIDVLCTIAASPLKPHFGTTWFKKFKKLNFRMSSDEHKSAASTPGVSRAYFDLKRFDSFCYYDIYRIWGPDRDLNFVTGYDFLGYNPLDFILTMIARLPMTCMYKEDYIYGISGLLGVDIPAEDNDESVWDSFRKIIQKTVPYVKFPKTSPLSGATNMQDVYKMFIGLDMRQDDVRRDVNLNRNYDFTKSLK